MQVVQRSQELQELQNEAAFRLALSQNTGWKPRLHCV
jgi:hypothetical protein